MDFLNQTVGIDVAKDSLVVHITQLNRQLGTCKVGQRKFTNTNSGIKNLVCWVESKLTNAVDTRFVMEATGRYHEQLAYHLYEIGYHVCIVLPNRIKYFARSINEHSKTDPIDAKIIANYGSLHTPDRWEPMSKSMRLIRELSRERQDIVRMRTQAKNRLHAQRKAARPHQGTILRLEQQIGLLDQQEQAVKVDLKELKKTDPVLARSVDRLTTIPGFGDLTAYSILGETGGFALFNNRSQVIKYTGLDVIEKQSGSSVSGKASISKRGNAHIRAALYMPAMSAYRIEGVFKNIYQRNYDKSGCHHKALMAVMRKLLIVAFGIHVKQIEYDKTVHLSRVSNKIGESEDPPKVAHSVN